MLAWFFGAIFVTLLLVTGLVQWSAAGRWRAVRARTALLLAESKARDSRRPVLRGAAEEGDAWADYVHLTAESDGPSVYPPDSEWELLQNFIERKPDVDRQGVVAIVERYQASLGSLQKGARKNLAFNEPDPSAWHEWHFGEIDWTRRVGDLARSQARLLAERGAHREAADLMLDLAQYARDYAHNRFLEEEKKGLTLYSDALDELKDLVTPGRLSSEALSEIARHLSVLDTSFPRHEFALRNERLAAGMLLERNIEAVSWNNVAAWKLAASGWRQAFSLRLLAAEGLDLMDEARARAEACETKSWQETRSILETVDRDLERCGASNLLCYNLEVTRIELVRRHVRTKLRLLRAATHFLATGEILILDDPFGNKIALDTNEGRTRFWSVGQDGVDNGGKGGWDAAEGPDLALEVRR